VKVLATLPQARWHMGVAMARSFLRFEDALADAASIAAHVPLLSRVEVRRGDILWTVRWIESVS